MRWGRFPLLALGMAALAAGLWAGLLRLGWALPAPRGPLAIGHGPLMVCGFLGTLISLERAVALERRWAYAAPLLAGLGGALLAMGAEGWGGPLLVAAGSGVLVVIFIVVLRMQPQPFVVVMALGAAAWLVGNGAWLAGAAVPDVVAWWMGFLVLTIAGERLELSRMLFHPPRVERLFLALTALLVVALGATLVSRDLGTRGLGLAFVALAAWLARYDVARHTVRQTGLTRFIAACLLGGYVWLAVGGALALGHGGVVAGLAYDAMLHAVLVGFVFSMIFGHAPIIFPSVLGAPVFYRPALYAPLVLLHASLGLRLAGDLGGHPALRRWGGLVNALAIVGYLGLVGVSILRGRRAGSA